VIGANPRNRYTSIRVLDHMKPEQVEATVDALAAAVGMPIAAECRAGVLQNWALMHGIAQAYLHFPLPADVEPASTFTP
jgi:hypothetical protein